MWQGNENHVGRLPETTASIISVKDYSRHSTLGRPRQHKVLFGQKTHCIRVTNQPSGTFDLNGWSQIN